MRIQRPALLVQPSSILTTMKSDSQHLSCILGQSIQSNPIQRFRCALRLQELSEEVPTAEIGEKVKQYQAGLARASSFTTLVVRGS